MNGNPVALRSVAGPESLLHSALVWAREMLREAEGENWEAVIAAEAERQRLIVACFETAGHDDQTVVEQIRELLAIDRQIMALARAGMADLRAALDALGRGRAARRAYGAAFAECTGRPPAVSRIAAPDALGRS